MEKSLYTKRHKALINALKEAREAAGLTQQAVADKLGKPQSFVAKYENGERRLDVIEFLAVVESLSSSEAFIIDLIKRV
ncbi:helix-turn-helix transcriptional regulator [bacterium SCSIO 12827]|nr:helix-turn-helix transcriptional regulator [bacterium SCSIO 12827]